MSGERVPTRLYVRSATVAIAGAVGAVWMVRGLLSEGLPLLASLISAVTVFLLVVYLRRRYSAMRWMAVGIALTLIFGVYPILYNITIGFTNMGNGHLLSRQQSIERLEAEQYLPEGADSSTWSAYRSGDSYAVLAIETDPPRLATDSGTSTDVELDGDEVPERIGDYTLMANRELFPIIDELSERTFGPPEAQIKIQSLQEVAASEQRYVYDAATDAMVDQLDGTVYRAEQGSWVSPDGDQLIPGFVAYNGVRNFDRFLGNENIRTPLLRVVVWNFTFAFLSVALSFLAGMAVSLLFDDLPGRRLIRTLLIVPYPIPVLVSVLIWRAMLNPDLGTIGVALESVFGSSPRFLLDANWTRFALILVNIWLSYPYFYVVTSGAMRAIPEDLYDAADVDGASPWQQFRFLTFPQVLAIVMPLLIASFSFNFNNFNLIYVFNYGNPPMVDSVIPVGQTDILISFIYSLAFETSAAADYGLGAAISVLLFAVVGSITWFQIRATRAVEAS